MLTTFPKIGILIQTENLDETLEELSAFTEHLSSEVQLFLSSTQESIPKELSRKIKLLPSPIHIYHNDEPNSKSTLFNALAKHAHFAGCTHLWFIFDERLVSHIHELSTYQSKLISVQGANTAPWYAHVLFGIGRHVGFPYPELTPPLLGIIIPTHTFLSLESFDESLFRELEVFEFLLKARVHGHEISYAQLEISMKSPALTPLYWLFSLKNHWIVLHRYFSLLRVTWWMSLVGLKLLIACIKNRKAVDLLFIVQGYLDGIKTVLIRK